MSRAASSYRSITDLGRPLATYVLHSLEDATLPLRVRDARGAPRDLWSEFLYLHRDGSFLLSTGLLPPGSHPAVDPGEAVPRSGTFTKRDGALTLFFDCLFARIGCTEQWIGRIDGPLLELRDCAGARRTYRVGFED